MSVLVFVLIVLASARTFKLARQDDAGAPIRRAFFQISHRLDVRGFSRLSDLVREGAECPYCFGYWYAVGWTLTGLLFGGSLVWLLLAGSFAANYVAGHLNAHFNELHPEPMVEDKEV